MNGQTEAMTQAILRSELYPFFARCMQDVMPGNYQNNWHMIAIAAELEKLISGETKRLIINIHPRMGKSLLCSVALPMFLLMKRPEHQIMCLSYSDSLASDFHQKCRMIALEPWYRGLNPELQFKAPGEPSLLKSSSDLLQTSALGYRMASSIGGSFTGKGADWIIIDDPNDMGLINSVAHRDKINNTYDTAIASRLNGKDGKILVVCQRGHINDLAGHLLSKGGFEQLKIEAVATEDQEIKLGKAGSYLRKKGELIHPTRFGLKEIDERRADLGHMAFEAQYQQNPQPPEGNLFKKEWIKWVSQLPVFQYIIITADIAQTSGGGDWSAFIVWGYHNGTWYVLQAHRVQYEMPAVLKYCQQLDQKYEPDLILIEANGPGAGAAAMLKNFGLAHVDQTTVKESKEVRALNITALLEKGAVVFSEKMENRALFMDELLSFPSSKYDDWVDAFTLALNKRHGLMGPANRYRRKNRRHLPRYTGNPMMKLHSFRSLF
ncbi:MAG: phage terminase large subunit [Aestuariivirga sp.]